MISCQYNFKMTELVLCSSSIFETLILILQLLILGACSFKLFKTSFTSKHKWQVLSLVSLIILDMLWFYQLRVSRPSEDHYWHTLGLARSNYTELKRAFRELAKTYHPDKDSSLSAREQWAEIQRAYDHLSSKTYF